MRRVLGSCAVAALLSSLTWTAGTAALAGPQPVHSGVTVAATNGHTDAVDCQRCHYCAAPSSADRCLREPCMRHLQARPPDEWGPDVVILDALASDYLPVPFDHAGHARMAVMGQGCATCHHHSTATEQPPACATCHDPSVEGTDPRKPGLKGAYHQQCLNCHREWIDETACDTCHVPRSGRRPRPAASVFPTADDALSRMHPPILQPADDFYRGFGGGTGRVLFYHGEHVERFGLTCVECHHEPSCARCHAADSNNRPRPTQADHHRPCIRCHKDDMDLAGRTAGQCEHCHLAEGAPKPPRFDHATVGWPLSSYHQQSNCRACHSQTPFRPLDRRCDACHSVWSPSTFNHDITGQALDTNHASLDCESCHLERTFETPPTCTECHDAEDDGISFPTRRPGEQVRVPPSSGGPQ